MELYGGPLSDELIDWLTSDDELWAVIGRGSKRDGILEPRKPCQEPAHTSLGTLDVLPMELICCVLGFLEFQPFMQLMRVSRQWKIVAETLPTYVALMKHVQAELALMGPTGILKYHSISALHDAMLSPKCVSCFQFFGGFLFLPTCERICFTCLLHNQAYWMLEVESAQHCFSLTEAEVLTLPIMKTIPGTYALGELERTVHERVPLVSVKQTKELAIKVHGSAEMMAIKFVEKEPFARHLLYRWLHKLSLEPPGRDLSQEPMKVNSTDDDFPGMAAIRFPYVHGEEKDIGRLCRGCEYLVNLLLPRPIIARNVRPGIGKWPTILALSMRLRLRQGFVEHISTGRCRCFGVEKLLRDSEKEKHRLTLT